MRLRILMLASAPPFPPLGGTPMRTYQLLRHLAGRHQVSLLAYDAPNTAEAAEELGRLGVALRVVPAMRPEGPAKRRMQLATMFSPVSYQHRSLYSGAMQQAISRRLARNDVDLVLVERSQMSGYAFGSHAVLVLNEHNLEYEALYRSFVTERSIARRLYNLLEYVKFRRAERAAWARFDACVITSERERAVITARLPRKPTAAVFNGVDLDHFRPSAAPVDASTILFTGSIDYRPNTDAVLHFAREIFPQVIRAHPNAVLMVVGMRPPPEITALAGRHVVITGAVPDVRPYLQRATVVVAPLRMGSGTRLKLLEAMAMGKAVVSTSLGAEGLAVERGTHLLIADESAAFAADVIRLLDDPSLAGSMGRAGRDLVEREYGWGPAGERLDEFLTRLVESRRGVSPALVQRPAASSSGLV
jgi:sugar transferase (PEP-CTERM/EpsH1 system associated)